MLRYFNTYPYDQSQTFFVCLKQEKCLTIVDCQEATYKFPIRFHSVIRVLCCSTFFVFLFKQEYKNADDVVEGYLETPKGFGDVVKAVFTIVNSEPTENMVVSGFKVQYCKEIGKYYNKCVPNVFPLPLILNRANKCIDKMIIFLITEKICELNDYAHLIQTSDSGHYVAFTVSIYCFKRLRPYSH